MATMYYRPYTAEPIRDGEMPPYEAMESILPEYQYIFTDGDKPEKSRSYRKESQRTVVQPGPSHRTTVTVEPTQIRYQQTSSRTVPVLEYDQSINLIDQQIRDVDNYRSAITRMGNDIVTLRNTVRGLENNNSQLRSNLNNYNDATQLIVDSTQMDGLSRDDLASRYGQLKQKLVTQTSSLKNYKDKVQKLQNELIKKNDKEKEYLKMSHAHASQQELLQRLQEKIRKLQKLEETCRKQERVIEKLERIIYKMKNKGEGVTIDFQDAMAEENRRLRQQIADLQEQLHGAGRNNDDMEKLELYQALERAEGRIMSLEKQLADNSRNWGREKADMSIRLNEAEHGLGRNAAAFAHEYPTLDDIRLQRALRLDPLLR